MSQEKVNRYKEQKKNRENKAKKEKFHYRIEMTIWALVGIAFIGWIGYSFYGVATRGSADQVTEYTLDSTALDDYVNGLNATEAAE